MSDPGKPVGLWIAPSSCRKRCVVDLQFYHPTAREVHVVGKFGEGKDQAISLEHLGSGAWVARLILPPGRYTYHFLADGEWRSDPLATEVSYGPYGEVNSVMVIE